MRARFLAVHPPVLQHCEVALRQARSRHTNSAAKITQANESGLRSGGIVALAKSKSARRFAVLSSQVPLRLLLGTGCVNVGIFSKGGAR